MMQGATFGPPHGKVAAARTLSTRSCRSRKGSLTWPLATSDPSGGSVPRDGMRFVAGNSDAFDA